MGFISRLKERLKTVGTSIRERADHVWQGVKEVSKEVLDACRIGVNIVQETIKNWGDRIKKLLVNKPGPDDGKTYINSVLAGQHRIVEEKPDLEVKEKSKRLLDRTFHGDIVGTLRNKQPEERIKILEDFGKEASQIFGVEDIPVNLEYPANPREMRYCGYYNDTDKTVHINAAFVESGTPRLAAEQVFTILHELNHARQWATIRDYEKYGYSPQRAWEFALNMRYYIRPEECDLAYRLQPVEVQSYELETELKTYCNLGPVNE